MVHNFPPKLQLSLQIEANGQQAHGMPCTEVLLSRTSYLGYTSVSPYYYTCPPAPHAALIPCHFRTRARLARAHLRLGGCSGGPKPCSALPPLLTACSSTTRASSGTVSSCDSAPTRDDRPCARETSVSLTARTSAAPSPARRTATPHTHRIATHIAPHRTAPHQHAAPVPPRTLFHTRDRHTRTAQAARPVPHVPTTLMCRHRA